jgi:hypothetical protein
MADGVLIQGKEATDIEYRVAVSLSKYKWNFEFQVPYLGGREIMGGQVVDFVVLTLPLPTPLWVQGEYWHETAVTDRDKLNREFMFAQMHGTFAPPIILWGIDLETQEESDETILKTLGRN